MTYFDAVILGVIQALTEFLPVSSSGHLVLGQSLFGIEATSGIAVEIMVHLGTLFSVIFCYRKDLKALLMSIMPGASDQDPANEEQGWSEIWLLFLGCLPAGIIGLTFKAELEEMFGSPTFVAWALLVTGIVLLSTRMTSDTGRRITPMLALAIGIAQAVAIVPGISRAGATIAMAMWLGVPNHRGARYSFFLSIPVIAGASLIQLKDLTQTNTSSEEWSLLCVAAMCAFVCGVLALRLLLVLLDRGVFSRFGWYCLSVGVAALCLL